MTEEEIIVYLRGGGDPRRLIVAHLGAVMASSGRVKRAKRSSHAARRERKDPLIADLASLVRRYVVLTPEQLTIVALWVIHTYSIDAFEQTPYLAVTSPEKQCGKTRLLETLDLLVRRSWMTILPSEAVLYRHIDSNRPTLLLDETDTIFNPKTAERYEAHRAILNAGHRRGNKVPRCVGATQQVVEFEAFCPKVLSGIGTIPDTIADRSIPIRLERRRRDEKVERFLRRDVEPAGERLRERAEAWAERNKDALRDARPSMPDQLSDRMQEGCEGLVAIADMLGYGEEAREALVGVFSVERLDAHESMRLRLLADLRAVFESRGNPRGVTTKALLSALHAVEDGPWTNYYGRLLEARDLAALLSHYGVSPTTIRPKDGESGEHGSRALPAASGYGLPTGHAPAPTCEPCGRYLAQLPGLPTAARRRSPATATDRALGSSGGTGPPPSAGDCNAVWLALGPARDPRSKGPAPLPLRCLLRPGGSRKRWA